MLNRGLAHAEGIAALIFLCVAVPLFWVQELRHPRPVVQLRLFRDPAFLAANGGVGLSNLAMYVTLFALPILLTREGGWSTTQIGLVLASLPLAWFAVSPLGGRLADRFGPRLPTFAGLAVFTGGLVPFALAPTELSRLALVATLIASGIGLGFATAPLQMAAIEAVDVSEAGIASGIFSTSRYLGSITGTSFLAGPLAPAASGFGGFKTLFAILVGAGVGSTALALALPGRTRPKLAPEAPEAAVH
jgi:MFS family permease